MPFPSQYGTVNKSVHQHNLQMAVQKVHVPQQDKGQWVPWVSSLLGFRQGLRRGVREEKGAGEPWECMSTQIKAALRGARHGSKAPTACRGGLPSEVPCVASEMQEGKESETGGNALCLHSFICARGLASTAPGAEQSPARRERRGSYQQGPGARGCSASCSGMNLFSGASHEGF